MPGLVLCNRRWAIASDDIFIPAIILCAFHVIGATALICVLSLVSYEPNVNCSLSMYEFLIGYLIILLMMLILEFIGVLVSCRGTVSNHKPRKFLQQIIYSRLVLFLVEISFIIWACVNLVHYRNMCLNKWHDKLMRQSIITIVVISSMSTIIFILSITCVYDGAGKSFHKLKVFESNYNNHPHKITDSMRHLRHKDTLRQYHKNWKMRCKLLCCCVKKNKNKHAFTDIAETLSCFFYKYDVVPSDILAGLLLIRDRQQFSKTHSLKSSNSKIFDYLSGVAVTQSTKFYNLHDRNNLENFKELLYFADYASASYGWPFYAYKTNCAFLKLIPTIKNCFCPKRFFCFNNGLAQDFRTISLDDLHIQNDNCCFCYYDAVVKQLPEPFFDSTDDLNEILFDNGKKKQHIKMIFANFSSKVGKPSYFVALDHLQKKVVITIRGTESLTDSITDLQIRAMPIPTTDPSLEWHGHGGIVKAAINIKSELETNNILNQAFNYDKNINTNKYELLIVGHSLGAGVGSILAILLKNDYPSLKCFSYSPPGGLLSQPCMEATKEFITTVILGKDMVPRLGMVQMEKLRNEIMETLKNTSKPKWQILSKLCCYKCIPNKNLTSDHGFAQHKASNAFESTYSISAPLNTTRDCIDKTNKPSRNSFCSNDYRHSAQTSRLHSDLNNMSDTNVCISSPLPQVTAVHNNGMSMYPPGRILHIVRKYPRPLSSTVNSTHCEDEQLNPKLRQHRKSNQLKDMLKLNRSSQPLPVYQIIETDNKDFNELLISPRMIQDHLPNNLIKCMKAVLEEPAPKKPPRKMPASTDSIDMSYDENDMEGINNFNEINELSYKTDKARVGALRKKKTSSNRKLSDQTNLEECEHLNKNKHNDCKNHRHSCINFENIKSIPCLKQYKNIILNNHITNASNSEKSDNTNLKSLFSNDLILKLNKSDDITLEKLNKNLQRQVKSMSVCSYDKVAYSAPLAKPESFSDLFHLEENMSLASNKSYKSKASKRKHMPTDKASINNNQSDTSHNFCNEQDNDLYYDDSINLKNPIFDLQLDKVAPDCCDTKKNDDEIKSSLVWWNYQESSSNIDNGNRLMSMDENKHDESDYADDRHKNLNLYGSNDSNVSLEHRIVTSTPRIESFNLSKKLDLKNGQFVSGSPLTNRYYEHNETKPKQAGPKRNKNEMLILNAISAYEKYTQKRKSGDDMKLKSSTGVLGDESHSEMQLSSSTSSSTNLDKLINNLNLNNHIDYDDDKKSNTSSIISRNQINSNDTFVTTTTNSHLNYSNNSNLDLSNCDKSSDLFKANDDQNMASSSSFSFNKSDLSGQSSDIKQLESDINNIYFNKVNLSSKNSKSQNELTVVSAKKAKKSKKNKTSNSNANANNNDESMSANYTSIEKLAILKPQSKDYILCFDTSSIDQNSTNDLNECFNFNLTQAEYVTASEI